MKHISTLTSATLKQTAAHGGCGECQTSCQSACKTSCTVANQKCEHAKRSPGIIWININTTNEITRSSGIVLTKRLPK